MRDPALPPATGSRGGGRVLIVDDSDGNVRLLTRILRGDGHTVLVAQDGEEALSLVRQQQPDVILMDVMMPGLDGFEACGRIKDDPGTRLIPVVLVTALRDSADRIRGLEAGADDFISKPFNAPELCARVRSLLRIKRYTDDLDSAESVIMGLAMTIEARDKSTDGHCQRLAAYAAQLGEVLGLASEDVAVLNRGGFLHDVGKVGIPDAVLLKAGRLTHAEFELMKQHPVIGDQLCGEFRSLRRVRQIVRHHHEHLDGSGYPDGLRGDAIPVLAQITAIVDVFDALTSVRPYKQALTIERACAELIAEADRGWRNREFVNAFVKLARTNRLPVFVDPVNPRRVDSARTGLITMDEAS